MYREKFIETLDSLDPDAEDGEGGGTRSLMTRNDWREEFSLVLLPRPLQMRKQSENGEENGAIKERWRHGSYNQEDLGAPIHVEETTMA